MSNKLLSIYCSQASYKRHLSHILDINYNYFQSLEPMYGVSPFFIITTWGWTGVISFTTFLFLIRFVSSFLFLFVFLTMFFFPSFSAFSGAVWRWRWFWFGIFWRVRWWGSWATPRQKQEINKLKLVNARIMWLWMRIDNECGCNHPNSPSP